MTGRRGINPIHGVEASQVIGRHPDRSSAGARNAHAVQVRVQVIDDCATLFAVFTIWAFSALTAAVRFAAEPAVRMEPGGSGPIVLFANWFDIATRPLREM